uniref:Transposase n=1 Tax=Heterorhabditis bacteriophora TaxID=37862 RepID=A0A1I7WJX1_HETBA
MEPAGFDTSITTPYASPTTTRPRQHLMHPLFWMTIVEQLSLGRVFKYNKIKQQYLLNDPVKKKLDKSKVKKYREIEMRHNICQDRLQIVKQS